MSSIEYNPDGSSTIHFDPPIKLRGKRVRQYKRVPWLGGVIYWNRQFAYVDGMQEEEKSTARWIKEEADALDELRAKTPAPGRILKHEHGTDTLFDETYSERDREMFSAGVRYVSDMLTDEVAWKMGG